MGQDRYDNRRRPSLNLDAGYVSIKAIDRYKTSKILGLHGKKFICVILLIFLLFFISLINLTCLIWIMYKLDWSPFHRNESKIFRFDKVDQQIELHNQGIFKETIYTTKIKSSSPMNLTSEKLIDIYGDHNSIFFDNNQISINTEYFYMKNKSLVDFNKLQLYQFNDKRRTKIHLEHINSQNIHDKYLNINTNNHITIANTTEVAFHSQNLTLEANRHNRRSILHFNNYPQIKKNFNQRQKSSHGNMDFRSDLIFFDLRRFRLSENDRRSESNIYRICICNTTFLLLRSFAHQPCPLC